MASIYRIEAWIIVREEKHVDPKYWVTLDKKFALDLAQEVADYWQDRYELSDDEIEAKCFDDQIFHVWHEDYFRVFVQPQEIRSGFKRDFGEVEKED